MPAVSRIDPRAVVASAPYERKRLIAASRLGVQRTENPNEFFVQSRSHPNEPRAVKLDNDPMCYCEDNRHTTTQCAHVLAARLASGDMPLIQALGNMLLQAENNLKQHTKRTRRTPGCQTGER